MLWLEAQSAPTIEPPPPSPGQAAAPPPDEGYVAAPPPPPVIALGSGFFVNAGYVFYP